MHSYEHIDHNYLNFDYYVLATFCKLKSSSSVRLAKTRFDMDNCYYYLHLIYTDYIHDNI